VTSSRSLRVGSDHVIVHPDRLIVISRANMDAWTVRSHRQLLVRFEGRNWRIAETSVVPPDSTRYTLAPWEAGDHVIVGSTIDYGPEYVAERDRAAAHSDRHRRASGRMRLVAPFTGFLSARIKGRLEVSHGIDPVASTKQSVIMETIVILQLFGAMQVAMMTGAFPYLPCLEGALFLIPDAAVRWDRVLAEVRPPPGFYEWLFRRGRA